MVMTNHERVGKALTQLQAGLSPFIERELKAKYGQEWAPEGLKMLRAKMGSWQGRSEADPLTSADDAEVGGLRGREALNRLRNAIGRVESSWRPASAEALTGLLVKPDRVRRQMELERPSVTPPGGGGGATPPEPGSDKVVGPGGTGPKPRPRPRRFHGAVKLEAARTGRDAGKVADEVLAHLVGLVGAEVTVTLEISAWAPDGVPEHVVRTVTENCRTLKFEDQGFEVE